ncbi:retrovirus-related Pol polyprotein from transposon 412 [Trichonephila clavipes]|nr:retrovirus-related Pol polyprotein from transposon 412 [Trichonephila clavipes]
MPVQLGRGQRYVAEGSCIATMLEHPSNVSLSDILGPLPRTASGNKYLLVVMDYFTKWPEVYPIPDQEAPTVAEAVVQHWISRYGAPLQLHSDQGKKFHLCGIEGGL